MIKTLLSEVELLDAAQIETLYSFNNTAVDYNKSPTVFSLLESPAIIFADKKITYGELDKISNDITAYILQKNISKGEVISILIPHCEFMPITSLGALKADCAYQPLDNVKLYIVDKNGHCVPIGACDEL